MFCLLKLKKKTLKNLSRLIFVTSNTDSTTVIIQSAIRTLVTLLFERRNSMKKNPHQTLFNYKQDFLHQTEKKFRSLNNFSAQRLNRYTCTCISIDIANIIVHICNVTVQCIVHNSSVTGIACFKFWFSEA